MGGAFIGVADDWTAIYWNPAGLTQLKGHGMGFSLEYLHAAAHDSNVPGQPDPSAGSRPILFAEMSSPKWEVNRIISTLSILDRPGFCLQSDFMAGGREFTFGGGSYVSSGATPSMLRTPQTPGYDVSFKSQGYIVNHNFSVAHPLGDWMQIGAGVTLLQAHTDALH